MNLRTTAEVRASLERAADRSGRSLIQEVEQRLELASYLLDRAGAPAELSDHLFLPQWIDFIRRAVVEAGESSDQWYDYTIPWNHAIDTAIGREQAFARVEADVQRAYRESKDFIAKHGAAGASDEYRRHLPGTARPEAMLARAIHREHAERVRRIEANAPPWLSVARPHHEKGD